MNVFFKPSERTYHEEMIQLTSLIPLLEDARFHFSLLLVFPIMKYLLRYVARLVWSNDGES